MCVQVLLVAGCPAPGGWLCSVARGREPLAGGTPGWGPAASEPVYRYREDGCRTLQVGHRRPGHLVVVTTGAGFRVVSASHTLSRRKFKSHRGDLKNIRGG